MVELLAGSYLVSLRRSVFSDFNNAYRLGGDFVKMHFDLEDQELGLRFYVSNQFSHDAHDAGQSITIGGIKKKS
jgi:hypothetical protein